MKKTILLLLAAGVSSSAFALNCKATFRDYVGGNDIYLEKELESTDQGPILTTKIEKRDFFATRLSEGKSVLLQIIDAENNLNGVTARSVFTKDEGASLSDVQGNQVYRVECRE